MEIGPDLSSASRETLQTVIAELRRRMEPTRRVVHALESCPECGTGLAGGWVQRTREVIELPAAPAEVTEHVFVARMCAHADNGGCPRVRWQGLTVRYFMRGGLGRVVVDEVLGESFGGVLKSIEYGAGICPIPSHPIPCNATASHYAVGVPCGRPSRGLLERH